MQKPYKNSNFNARFATAGFCAEKFKKRGVKFYPCGAEPRARDAALGGFKFRDEKFCGANFMICGTEFLKTNFRGMEFCKSKFRARGVKFYKVELRETDFLTRTAKFYEMKFQTPNLELKMKFSAAKFGGVKFRGALLKLAAAKELRSSPNLCAATPFKFTAPQNARFFETKFGEAEFYSVKFHKARLCRAKFYAAEFAVDGAKFCGAKRRGVGA